jgi:activating signal cointegrator 1
MKYAVLSLNPPYGSLIAACEAHPTLGKHIETRDWATTYRGPLLIHQTKGLGEMFANEAALWDLCLREPFRTTLTAAGYDNPGRLPRGAIVAVCELKAIAKVEHFVDGEWSGAVLHYGSQMTELPDEPELSFGDYSIGRYAWLLADIRALPEPIAARGMPGLWEWEGELGL